MSFGRKKETKTVGYVSKSGNLRAYKLKATTKNKFGDGNRVLLQSFGNEPVEFWVDEAKLTEPPPNKNNGCGCECNDCQPFCRCEDYCNCRGGNVYDC